MEPIREPHYLHGFLKTRRSGFVQESFQIAYFQLLFLLCRDHFDRVDASVDKAEHYDNPDETFQSLQQRIFDPAGVGKALHLDHRWQKFDQFVLKLFVIGDVVVAPKCQHVGHDQLQGEKTFAKVAYKRDKECIWWSVEDNQ
jgi:hypothetical protein